MINEPRQYFKKPIPLWVWQWRGGTKADELPSWVKNATNCIESFEGTITGLTFKTLEGVMRSKLADCIVQGIRGEVYSVDREIFEESYEEIK